MLRRQAIRVADALGVGNALRRAVDADSLRMSAQFVADDQCMLAAIAARLLPDSNAIDVGAHEGGVLTQIVRCAPQGKHVAFEPLPHFAAKLEATFPDVDVRCAAASDRFGRSSFVHVVTHPEYSGLRQRDLPPGVGSVEPIEVALEPIDGVLPEDFVPSLIKIDVEGAELQVLQGAIETIARHRPLVIFEHGNGAAEHYGTTSAEVHDILCRDAGLRIYNMQGGGPYSREEFSDLFDKPVWNFMAT